MINRIYKIYRLVNPITGKTFYIGSTEKELHERLFGHLTACKKGKSKISVYLNWLRLRGIAPKIELIEITPYWYREIEIMRQQSKVCRLRNTYYGKTTFKQIEYNSKKNKAA